jgi:hypothetical protein
MLEPAAGFLIIPAAIWPRINFVNRFLIYFIQVHLGAKHSCQKFYPSRFIANSHKGKS